MKRTQTTGRTQRTACLAGLAALAWSAAAMQAAAQGNGGALELTYEVDVRDAKAGEVRVRLSLDGWDGGPMEIRMPAWSPGAYRIADYGKRVQSMEWVGGDGTKRAVERTGDNSWTVDPAGARAGALEYRLKPGDDRASAEHAFLEGPGTYVYLEGHKERPADVRFAAPEGWKIATGLEQVGKATYHAPDYDVLADCPVEIGTFRSFDFTVNGAKYEAVMHGPDDLPTFGFVDALRIVARHQTDLMGGAPYDRYVFLFHFHDGRGGGGLEHLNSTNISYPSASLREDPIRHAEISAHEFFHVWNVKRLRPAVLGPFDYQRPCRTKALWFCEGVTSYYASLTCVRTGLWTEDRFLEHMMQEMNSLEENPDRRETSLEDASWNVWEGEPERISYYTKGELVGMLFDLELRRRTGGRASFDDVVRRLYGDYVKAGPGPIGRGYPEDGILKALNDVGRDDFSPEYRAWVSGTEELPYARVLEAAGLDVAIERGTKPDCGFRLRRGTAGVSFARRGSDAAKKGVKRGLVLHAVDGTVVEEGKAADVLDALVPGKTAIFEFHEKKGDKTEIVMAELVVGTRETAACKIVRRAEATEEQRALYRAWVDGK